MQESTDSHQTSGESCLPKAAVDSGRCVDSPGLSSCGKSKKRERPDQNSTAGTKVQLMDDCNNPQKHECAVNLVDDGGGLANTDAVDLFLFRMKEGKSSSLQRSAVAKILVATANNDCLKKFVCLGGVSILEEWIQECAKIRSTDAAVKDSDKALDEEMMMILQALEKLPISLETLKGCSIGKSVKQLRSVRNGEIQKKAKKLVDTWRKRVDLEIKQGCAQPSVAATERLQLIDVMSHASDQSPSKVTEAYIGAAVKSAAIRVHEDSNVVKSPTPLKSNSANGHDGSPKEHLESSPEKDAVKKIARLPTSSFTSVTGLNISKKQKLSTDKDEPSNFLDYQNLEEKHMKGETGSNHASTDIAVKKTNEYRKKLRSGGSIALPCSTESNTMGLPGNAVQSRDNNSEKATCTDSKVCDSEQRCHTEQHSPCPIIGSVGERAAYEASDLPNMNDNDATDRDEHASYLHVQGCKVEHMNESCLSSQSSCSNKRNLDGPKGLIVEKTVSTSLFQGDAKVCPSANLFPEQANDLVNGKGVLQGSSKTLSPENNHTDVFAHKLSPKAEPYPTSESVVNVGLERNRSLNATQGVEIGAADREESCCSHNTQMYREGGANTVRVPDQDENAEQITAEHSPAQPSGLEAVGARDGAACSETTKFLSYSCQESENGNLIKAPTLATNGQTMSNLTAEIDKVHTALGEIPSSIQSCHDFDLNEGLAMEEFGHDTQLSCGPPSSASCVVPKVTGTLSAPVAVSAATKGAFIPSLNAPNKSDIGWKGSAATSAFRPAEPRHASVKVQTSAGSATTEARNVNCFDLNVTDHDSFEDPPVLPSQGLQEVRMDLNHDGKVNHMTSILESSKRSLVGSPGNCSREKRAMLDFDLNEELNEVPKEQVIVPPSAVKAHDGLNTYRGLPETGVGGDYALWNSAEGSFYPGSAAAIGPKFELFCSGSSSQPVISSRQATPAFVPPPSTSFVFSQASPFFGGSQQPYPASFTYNPMSAGLDTSFMVSRGFPETSFVVSKGMAGSVGSPMDVRSRPEMPVRPTFLPNMDTVRGGNNLFAWGRAPQNIYGNSGAAIMSYNDATVGGSEHVVSVDRHASVEEQMRVFQHPVVPVSSLKRREPDYFPGLKQTTWN